MKIKGVNMAKKEILFEGVIDKTYSQILVDRESNKWFLLGHVKDFELQETKAMVDRVNQSRSGEDKVKLVEKLLGGKKTAFIYFQIDEKTAVAEIDKNKKNQIQTGTKIQDLPKQNTHLHNGSFVKKLTARVKTAKSNVAKKVKQMSPVRVVAGVALSALIVGGVAFGISKIDSKAKGVEPVIPENSVVETTQQQEPQLEVQRFDLEDVILEINATGALSSDCVKTLSLAIVDELEELYKSASYDLPKVLESEILSSIFFFENDCYEVESKSDSYVGIAQIGTDAVHAAILRADKLFSLSNEDAAYFGGDNYIVDNICSKGRDVDELTNILWEQSKTDAKLCGTLAALCLGDLSDRNLTAYKENPSVMVTIYNAGEGNFEKFQQLGIITLSEDKQHMTIDLSKVDRITDPDLRKKWNESVNYLIKVMNGYQLLKTNPNANIHSTCQKIREKVGKKDSLNAEPNLEQYKYAPNGVSFVGLELDHGVQPGE